MAGELAKVKRHDDLRQTSLSIQRLPVAAIAASETDGPRRTVGVPQNLRAAGD